MQTEITEDQANVLISCGLGDLVRTKTIFYALKPQELSKEKPLKQSKVKPKGKRKYRIGPWPPGAKLLYRRTDVPSEKVLMDAEGPALVARVMRAIDNGPKLPNPWTHRNALVSIMATRANITFEQAAGTLPQLTRKGLFITKPSGLPRG